MSKRSLAAAILLSACLAGQLAALAQAVSRFGVSPVRTASLRYDPRFVLEAVARRMGIRLRPDIPVPSIRLESRTPLLRMQIAAERQWGFRPQVFVTAYASAGNEIFLIDEADHYRKHQGSPDGSLAHELVHYLQAHYLRDGFTTDWSESQAVAVQTWFKRTYMAPSMAATLANIPMYRNGRNGLLSAFKPERNPAHDHPAHR